MWVPDSTIQKFHGCQTPLATMLTQALNPGDNVIIVSNRGLKTGENSRNAGEFREEIPDIN